MMEEREREAEWNESSLFFLSEKRPEGSWTLLLLSILPLQKLPTWTRFPLAAVKYLHLLEKVDVRRL